MTILEQGWAALPASYRPPAHVPTLAEARAYCERLARSHYENFSVASFLLPREARIHFHAIYAYCRIADDLGDEVSNPDAALALLDFWRQELAACYAGSARHPVFVALADTIRRCGIPQSTFADLLTAFRQDQTVHRYGTWEEILDYCRNSANPVGRLVLYACGEAGSTAAETARRFACSDATCTALQLANFWQDVRRDYAKGRIYLPQEDLRRFGVAESAIQAGAATAEFRALLRHEVDRTWALFAEGRPLIGMVGRRVALDLELFSRGGEAVLRAIERQNYDVLSRRPVISKPKKALLLVQALLSR